MAGDGASEAEAPPGKPSEAEAEPGKPSDLGSETRTRTNCTSNPSSQGSEARTRTCSSLNLWKACRLGAGAEASPRPAGAPFLRRPLWRVEEVKTDLGTSSAAPARQVLPQNTGLEQVKMAWAELQQAWETVLWQTKMRAYLPQPSRRLAGKPPPRQPNHRKVLHAGVSCGGRRTLASLPNEGEEKNGDKGDLSPDMELPTWIHKKTDCGTDNPADRRSVFSASRDRKVKMSMELA
ncbi:hypothetical protein CRENBAI_026688 [Crenichthys baileyi]|uniref:Uncharacterized protein n=1 Tax=Crenichthys baileyi TaxID=28760 RepID=A0AAV9QZ37_9TELE